jgi:hypothetical protein
LRTVYIVLSCDTDPDRQGFLDGVPSPSKGLAWRGMTEGIPAAKTFLRDVRDSRGREPVFTWLLRVDDQVRRMQGDYAWVMQNHDTLLRSLQESGDELGWHPHFWRRESERDGATWFQEVEDVDWQVQMMHEANRAMAQSWVGKPQSVRMGWAYHNNRTFAALDELGVAVDCSALPGYRTFRGRPPTRGENNFDWRSSPRRPFRPSRNDYRRPPAPGEDAFRVLEVPGFMSGSIPWALVSSLQLARKTGDLGQVWDAIRRPSYNVNITTKPVFFAPLVAALRSTLKRVNGPEPIVFSTQCHADEFLPNKTTLYSLSSVKANLEALIGACDAAGVPVQFTQLREIAALF